MARTLSHHQARAVYDRIGAGQDRQGFYEDAAVADLIAHLGLDDARAVLEFGCGTGRLAATLLAAHLGPDCRYLALDSSPTMARLAQGKLAPWAGRAEVRLSDGSMELGVGAGEFDRFLSAYVLDLLSEVDIGLVVAEAHRVLAADGRLGLVGLTSGRTPLARLVSGLWRTVHRLEPRLVGGCRPLELTEFLAADRWHIEHHNVVSPWGISSEIVVARRLPARETLEPGEGSAYPSPGRRGGEDNR